MRKLLMLGIVVGLSLSTVLLLSAEPRYALVIGNGDYAQLAHLKNPVNDATDMASTLRGLNFTVTLLTNADQVRMDQAVVRFGNELSTSVNAIGFFYYAGHGVQAGGRNYLIPVDADIPSAAFLSERALALQSVLDTLNQAKNTLNVVVLDACRDDPFSWARGATRGLTVVESQPTGSIIAYSAGAGQVALDGNGSNGIYTGELLKYLKEPGLDIFDVLRKTGAAVSAMTNEAQDPAIYTQFYGQVYLAGAPQAVVAAVSAAQTVAQPQPQSQAAPAVPEGMVLVQGGTFTMGDTAGGGNADERPLHQVTVSSFYMAKTEVTQADFQSVMGFNPSHFRGDNLPVDSVTWYDAVAYCNARSQREGFQQVYQMSRIEKNASGDITSATVAADWSAAGYRLPTEAEWEYAAKGGNQSLGYKYAGSNDLASVAWASLNSGGTTHPVGQKQANELGLYDMSGNVYEWCWDWYGSYSSANQTDPHGPASGQYRVLRGGSWGGSDSYCRSSLRFVLNPIIRVDYAGFRPVRSTR